ADLLEANVSTTARLYASEVDDFLAQKTAMLDALAAGVAPENSVLTEVVRGSAELEELMLLDAAGEIAARSADGEAWALQACRVASPGGPMSHAQHGHGHEVVVAVPRGDGGRLCARTSFTLHQDMIRERARGTFGGLAYIVDQGGSVVCHAFLEEEPHIEPGEPILGPAAAAAARGEPWSGVVQVDGVPHLAAFAPAATLPWGVWAEVPASQAATVLRPHTTQALAFGVALALALSGVVGVLAHRIAAPVEELEEAQRFSDTLLDTVEQRILVVGRDLRVIRANRAAREAWGDGVLGQRCRSIHGTEAGAPCPVEAVLATGEPTSDERVGRTADGRTEILAVDRYPLPGPGGPRGVLEIARDVTEREQTRAHLLHQQKMAALGTLAAGLAHEIGNPLASLSSELELLELDPDAMHESLPVLRDQVRRIGGLLRELVDLGRTPRDHVEAVDADAAIADVMRLVRHSARADDVRLVHTEAPGLVLHTNRDRLVQALLNLALNAVDAVEPGGCVTFVATRTLDGVRFRVSDDGPGVAPELRGRLFEPFYTTKAAGSGTGLGLFVVDRVVTALGGTVRVGDGPDGGAAFDIEFPEEEADG
ncbi:MAG: two-component system NtrC family sensor kinase, partial [Myxococcota bacterium]